MRGGGGGRPRRLPGSLAPGPASERPARPGPRGQVPAPEGERGPPQTPGPPGAPRPGSRPAARPGLPGRGDAGTQPRLGGGHGDPGPRPLRHGREAEEGLAGPAVLPPFRGAFKGVGDGAERTVWRCPGRGRGSPVSWTGSAAVRSGLAHVPLALGTASEGDPPGCRGRAWGSTWKPGACESAPAGGHGASAAVSRLPLAELSGAGRCLGAWPVGAAERQPIAREPAPEPLRTFHDQVSGVSSAVRGVGQCPPAGVGADARAACPRGAFAPGLLCVRRRGCAGSLAVEAYRRECRRGSRLEAGSEYAGERLSCGVRVRWESSRLASPPC